MKAVVFVDVQKDFVKNGALAFGYPAEDNVPKVVKFAKDCISKGYAIYATRDTHEKTVYDTDVHAIPNAARNPESTPIRGYMTTLEGKKLPVEHCVEGTDGWMLDDRLMEVLDGKCTFVNKPTFGSFDLAELIAEDFKDKQLDEIIICGYCTGICVISNALILRAKFPNTKITLKKDLCGCISEITHNSALGTAQCCQIDVE